MEELNALLIRPRLFEFNEINSIKDKMNPKTHEQIFRDYFLKDYRCTRLIEPEQKDYLLPFEREYIEYQKQIFMKGYIQIDKEVNQKTLQERPEFIKILGSIIEIAALVLLIYGIPYAYNWTLHFLNTNIVDWISDLTDLAKVMVCSFYVFIVFSFLVSILTGEFDPWIKKNIDPYIIKLKTWLNRRNE